MPNAKPHKGRIDAWVKLPCKYGLGYYITGRFVDHPQFGGMSGHTSYVVGEDGNEIETRNSRYTLGKPQATVRENIE